MSTFDDSSHTERLLEAAGRGDPDAISELIEMHRDYLKRVVDLRLDQALRGRVDASDIIQETSLVVAKRMEEFLRRRPVSFKLWLRAEALQQMKRQRRRHRTAAKRSIERECRLSEASSMMIARHLLEGTPSQIAVKQEQADRVRKMVEDLPEIDREIILLRYVEGLSNAEASELLDIEIEAARKRHGRALKRLLGSMIQEGLA